VFGTRRGEKGDLLAPRANSGLESCLLFLSGFRDRLARALRRSSPASPAGAARPGAVPVRQGAGALLAVRNWPGAGGLIVLGAVPAILGLTLAGLWVASAAGTAGAYGQVSQLAALGQQVTGLAHALGDERDGAAVFIAGGRPAADLSALDRQYAETD